jgi:hypothetical protein
MGDTRYCLCGATASATSTPPALAEGVVQMWDEWHTGDGHGPATQQQAAAARRREARALAREGGADR